MTNDPPTIDTQPEEEVWTWRDNKPFAFRLGKELAVRLAERGLIDSNLMRQSLERYCTITDSDAARLQFSVDELRMLYAIISEQTWNPRQITLLWAEVSNAMRYRLAGIHYNVDGQALIDKLRTMSMSELVTLVDAMERASLRDEATDAEKFRAVGLRV